jgi:hypothetical protein
MSRADPEELNVLALKEKRKDPETVRMVLLAGFGQLDRVRR